MKILQRRSVSTQMLKFNQKEDMIRLDGQNTQKDTARGGCSRIMSADTTTGQNPKRNISIMRYSDNMENPSKIDFQNSYTYSMAIGKLMNLLDDTSLECLGQT